MTVLTRSLHSSTYEDANAADGRLIVEWLDHHGLLENLRCRGDAVDRRIRAWRAGEVPSFYAVDKTLAGFDVHPSELPDEVWLTATWSPSLKVPA